MGEQPSQAAELQQQQQQQSSIDSRPAPVRLFAPDRSSGLGVQLRGWAVRLGAAVGWAGLLGCYPQREAQARRIENRLHRDRDAMSSRTSSAAQPPCAPAPIAPRPVALCRNSTRAALACAALRRGSRLRAQPG
jgi:hypothetical protein